jgi:hypothetical protein
MAVLRVQAVHWPAFLLFFLIFIHIGALPVGAQSVSAGDREKIPLLISDHHADHGPFMLRHFGVDPDGGVCMVVLDAHTDTVKNDSPPVSGNHNWICPLYPFPLESLVWIHTIAGSPNSRSGKVRDFYLSVSEWGAGSPPLNALALSLDQISHIVPSSAGQSLFISIDLDFFSIENNIPADIPLVFDTLFNFASRWQGKVMYALALSRPWLPDDEYAWELLRQSLRWFSGKTEFASPEITLFTVQREDTSAKARAYREMGLTIPSFYGRENEMPDDIRDLFVKLKRATPGTARAFREQGLLFLNRGDYDNAIADYNQAVADYEEALRIDPNHANARSNLENARRAQGILEIDKAASIGGEDFLMAGKVTL